LCESVIRVRSPVSTERTHERLESVIFSPASGRIVFTRAFTNRGFVITPSFSWFGVSVPVPVSVPVLVSVPVPVFVFISVSVTVLVSVTKRLGFTGNVTECLVFVIVVTNTVFVDVVHVQIIWVIVVVVVVVHRNPVHRLSRWSHVEFNGFVYFFRFQNTLDGFYYVGLSHLVELR